MRYLAKRLVKKINTRVENVKFGHLLVVENYLLDTLSYCGYSVTHVAYCYQFENIAWYESCLTKCRNYST